jgi:predicted nucleic acid-binding protein
MLCLDTYALVALHNNAPEYKQILDEEKVITSMTLAEFYGVLLRQHDTKTAEHWWRKLLPFCVDVDRETLREAVTLRETNRKNRLSFFDCVGYIHARKHGMRFVTGDKEFRGREGVLFIPAR